MVATWHGSYSIEQPQMIIEESTVCPPRVTSISS